MIKSPKPVRKIGTSRCFLANAAMGLTGMCLASLEPLRQLRRIAMARIVTNSLLFLFLVLGCGWLSKEEVQAPKAPEPTPAPVSSTPAEAASDRTTSATIAANTTVSKEELRMLQARLKATGFYVGPIDGIVGPKTKSALFRLQAACTNLKDLLETSAAGAQTANWKMRLIAVRRAKRPA